MIWVFGNSYERVPIKDLNDVIYYRQKKQYTDQEFEGSRDLQREIQKGRVIKLEHVPEIKSSLPDSFNVPSPPKPTVDISEIRRVITEVVSAQKPESTDIKSLVTNLVPLIAETVRQEVSKIQVQTVAGSSQAAVEKTLKFKDTDYIPEVKTDGLKSNITIEGRQVQGQDVANSLELLKRLNNK
jgi:hypothetical protein